MFKILKKRILPMGVDLGSGHMKIVQLGMNGNGIYLHAAALEELPYDIVAGSGDWQRWVAGTVKKLMNSGGFKGKEVITAIPSDDVFIDQIKIPRSSLDNLETTAFAKVEQKLPFEPKGAMVKYVVAERRSDNGDVGVLVMAAERAMVERHLAIYEEAGLELKSMSVWPMAMVNSYVRFFGRRAADVATVVMLMDIGTNHSNIVICRHECLLFARMIPIGFNQFKQGEMVSRLMNEAEACCRYFESVSNSGGVQRLIFLSGRSVNKYICERIVELAERLQIQAQIGDVLTAVHVPPGSAANVDRRNCLVDWATAFGLSLTEK